MTTAAGDRNAERVLVERMKAGDETALAQLYDAFAPLVYGLALRVCRNRSVADDVTQDVFTAFWQRPDRFDPELGSVRTFLGVVAHRRAVDAVRRESALKAREEREAQIIRPPTRADDVAEGAAAAVIAQQVRAALATLPAEQQEVVTLTYLDGQSYREVAKRLDIPEGTAKSRGRLGLAKLAAALEAQGITPWS
ncbi:MAG: RNA polymerase sigma factor [Acidimicrobiales bacterium]